MKTQENKTRIIMATVLVLSILLTFFLLFGRFSLKKQLSTEQAKTETILSEKLAVTKKLDNLRLKNDFFAKENHILVKELSDTKKKLDTKEAEVRKLMASNSNTKKLNKKLQELEDLNKQLKSEIDSYTKTHDRLQNENATLSEKLEEAMEKNKRLEGDNYTLKAMIADNYLLTSVKGKHEKLTNRARRADELKVSFDVATGNNADYNFKLVTPDGSELQSKGNPTISLNIVEENPVYARVSGNGYFDGNINRIEMSYKAEKHLQKGVYKFNVYNGKTYIGSAQLKLK